MQGDEKEIEGQEELEISLFDFVLSISHNLNLIYQDLEWHHEKVAYITCQLLGELDYSKQKKKVLIMAAALHDIGILTLEHEKIDVIIEALNNLDIDTIHVEA
jgi:HD-GYP domain-containing protein (c-di-GMP phosphodiesterase class II)